MSKLVSESRSMSTILSRHMIWSEFVWQGDMMIEDQMWPNMGGKKAAVTQKLCNYINVEAEPAIIQPAHHGLKNWLWLEDGDKGKGETIIYNEEQKQHILIWRAKIVGETNDVSLFLTLTRTCAKSQVKTIWRLPGHALNPSESCTALVTFCIRYFCITSS